MNIDILGLNRVADRTCQLRYVLDYEDGDQGQGEHNANQKQQERYRCSNMFAILKNSQMPTVNGPQDHRDHQPEQNRNHRARENGEEQDKDRADDQILRKRTFFRHEFSVSKWMQDSSCEMQDASCYNN